MSSEHTSLFAAPEPQPSVQPPRPSRLRRFFLRHLPLSIATLVVLVVIALVGAYFFLSSVRFENYVRRQLIAQIERATGGRVEVEAFHWRLLTLEAEADGLVIHGTEDSGEAPYASVQNLRVQVSVLNMMSPRLELRSIDVVRPAFHLIVYPDGTTNQPQPRKARKPGKPFLDTFFNLRAGRVTVEQGMLDYDNRSSSFDFQNRYVPLDFQARDVSVRMAYMAAAARQPERYHIEAGATDFDLTRGVKDDLYQPVHGHLQATLDLERNVLYVRTLRLTASSRKAKDRVVEISGELRNFAQPVWQARITGDLDMALLDPLTGYPNAPQGIAHLNLDAAGHDGEFRTDGTVHIDDGAYIGTGVNATGLRLDCHVHADASQLSITSIVARLRQGGQLEGAVLLRNWLPPIPAANRLQPSGLSAVRATGNRDIAPRHLPPPMIPVDGKVIAQFNAVSLDALMDMVGQGPFQRLGFDTLLDGPATATWTHGDTNTLVVEGSLNLHPSARPVAGEVPLNGAIRGTYMQRNGSVEVQNLALHMPGSQFTANGHLGAYPLDSPSALNVEFHSHNLAEFDAVLRDLGLKHNGKAGAAALPVALTGQADFQGTWGGSLVNPHIAGNLDATQVALELPATSKDPSAPPRILQMDSVQAEGSYSAARIAIDHALLQRGSSSLALSGTLQAATGAQGHASAFDANSALQAHLTANSIRLDMLRPFLGTSLPVTGMASAQLQINGQLGEPDGSGTVDVRDGSLEGQPFSNLQAQGTLAAKQLTVSSASVTTAGGTATATGSYDMQTRHFTINAAGKALDLAQVAQLKGNQLTPAGTLAFLLQGTGTLTDPRVQTHATLSSLVLGGQSLGTLSLNAHTANGAAFYDAATRLDGATLHVHGQTTLQQDYTTQARLDFSKFDIGTLLKLARVQSLDAQSALAGTITVQGPLAHPAQLHGEATLHELAVTVEGVHLKSAAGLHATLADGRIHLDPLHVTGEDTDLHAEGSLLLTGQRQLDLATAGSINLKLAETLDPDLTAAGLATFQVEAHGPLVHPGFQGRIDLQNGSLSLGDIPNGLSQLHGTLVFNQNRLEVQSLTAMSGGGLLSVGGSLAYQHGIYASLSVTGKGIRIRYPQGVSSLADASLQLQGPEKNLQLSGNILITRFSISPDLDIAALAAQANAVPTVAAADAPSNHIRLDVRIQSSPQLNFQNAFAKLAGDVDLHVRGTVANPSLLGSISVTEGSAMIAGTHYELQRGDITFTNPVRIEPSIDLSATARVQDYDITLGIHGTAAKPTVTYRSDPPLPEADVVGLLALGHTGDQQRLYTQQQEQSLTNPATDALLGGALNATVSSRVQKLFGAGSVKVDPNYLGAFGNSTSRITVEEQVGRNVTLTYATNVNTTGQQLLQAEIAINRHVSVLIARDESGVFSMVIKATRRYR